MSMSTPPTSASWAASMTRLPPSPDINPIVPAPESSQPKHLSLNDDNSELVAALADQDESRLRSVARYSSFHPQAIACSTPLLSHYMEDSDPRRLQHDSAGVVGKKHDGSRQPQPLSRTATSVAAIAGPQGVALFRVCRPQTPLVVLSHATSRKSSAAIVSSLAFQPNTKDSLLLAAARGNGILVWDASGHSLSPLLGRLSMEPSMSLSDRITSISWGASSSHPILATANTTNACLWDLRTSLRAMPSRPSVRLGASRKVNADGFVDHPLVQIAASNKDEVATLDAGGTVHVFDVRMTDRAHGKSGELTSFSAFHHVGIGLESFCTKDDGMRWVTWGLDGPESDAVVRVWSDRVPVNSRNDSDSDSYWFMDSSPTTSPKTSIAKADTAKSVQLQYQQVAEFSTPHLACARVCPGPFEDNVVTVGMMPGSSAASSTMGWQAEAWKLNGEPGDGSIGHDHDHRGMEKITSFKVMHDSQTTSMIGTNASLGSLRGAELALEPSRGVHGLQLDGDDDGIDLLLCCLSENGYVTTHVVLEAPPRALSDEKAENFSEGQDSPIRSRSQSAFLDRARIYPVDGSKRGRDSASMLRALNESTQIEKGQQNEALFQESKLEKPKSAPLPMETDLHYFPADKAVPSNGARTDGGTLTQFDMDMPVAYGGSVPAQGVTSLNVVEVSAPPVVLLDEKDEAIEMDLERQNIANRIDKDRVPCPRLCGGAFSPGIGGIVCFNNGEVRKMWSWYDQSDPRRRVHSLTGKGRADFLPHSNAGSQHDSEQRGDSSLFDLSQEGLRHAHRQECPRTLQDLADMTDHARFSQWRSDESSGGESSVDDESDESLDDLASTDEDDNNEARKRMYEKYFGVTPERLPVSRSKLNEETERKGEFSSPRSPPRLKQQTASSPKSNELSSSEVVVSPSSDLVPTVYITHEQDALVFNGQSKNLAREWKLGEWCTVPEDEIDSRSPRGLGERDSVENASGDNFRWEEEAVLPRPRSAEYYVPLRKEPRTASSSGNVPARMQRVQSDPMLVQASPGGQYQKRNRYNPNVGSDDAPVHAGAYSVRPNRNESMVFLKKLLNHGDKRLPSLMSPPDSPLLPNKMPFGRNNRRSTSSSARAQTPSPTSIAVDATDLRNSSQTAIQLGVYTLAEEQAFPRAQLREEKLRDTCLHNAAVCVRLGQFEKANVWKLLSQMADNVLEDEHDHFNGWGGPYSGSLGHDLVSSFLRFYEAQGDVQMLATLVCVLGGGRQLRVYDGCSLLPESHRDRYDSYIRRYADVLYGWRLMSIRAELNKHLVLKPPDASDGNDKFSDVGIAVWCSQCDTEVTTGDGICQQCRNYAFLCSICNIAVRGLFSLCPICGHGGHTSHMMHWFAEHSVCPTGCGCNCTLTMTTMQAGGVPNNELREPLQPILDEVLRETPELFVDG